MSESNECDQTAIEPTLSKKEKEKARWKRRQLKRKEKREQEMIDKITEEQKEKPPVDPELEKEEQRKKQEKEKAGDDEVCKSAAALWKFVTDHNTKPELIGAWKELSDEEKIRIAGIGFKDFTANYPVVAKYMIWFNMYSEKVFRRFLKQCRDNSADMQPVGMSKDSKEKMAAMKKEGQVKWCENNAWYGTWLWQTYEKVRHPKAKIEQRTIRVVYKRCLEPLLKEFENMEEMKVEAEEEIKILKEKTNNDSVREVLDDLRAGAHKNMSLDDKRKTLDILNRLDAINTNDASKREARKKKKDITQGVPLSANDE
jgi:hypothetical protein